MIYWPWLIIAFGAGWLCHGKLFDLGIQVLRKRGLKISMPRE
jgi:hypothetical protein